MKESTFSGLLLIVFNLFLMLLDQKGIISHRVNNAYNNRSNLRTEGPVRKDI
jgi:hypothetical protein